MYNRLLLALALLLSTFAAQDKPDKDGLIKVLNELHECLLAEKYDACEKLVHAPGLKKSDYPTAFGKILTNRELSKAGIQRLAVEAKFAPVAECFSQDRAASLAEKAGVSVDKLYGFYFETPEATAEVAAVWDGEKLKLILFDDIGKLASAEDGASKKSKADETPKPMSSEDRLKEIQTLVDAVNKDLKNPKLRSTLALKLYKAGDIKKAWRELRVASKLDPKNQDYLQGIKALLAEFESIDVFSVGGTEAFIINVLGEPDQKVELGKDRIRYVYSFVGVDFEDQKVEHFIDLRNATEALFKPTEIVAVTLDGRPWSAGFRKREAGFTAENWFLEDESSKSWTEQFAIQRILDVSDKGTAEEHASALIQNAKAKNENVIAKILVKDDESATLMLEVPLGENKPTIHRLIRMFKGPKDLHQISISMVKRPDEATQKKWFQLFQKAYLKPVNQSK